MSFQGAIRHNLWTLNRASLSEAKVLALVQLITQVSATKQLGGKWWIILLRHTEAWHKKIENILNNLNPAFLMTYDASGPCLSLLSLSLG